MNGDIYSSLLKGLVMPKYDEISSYPVCVSAAGAVTNLLEVGCAVIDSVFETCICFQAILMLIMQSEYLPPEWLPVLQVVLSGFGQVDEIDCILLKLLSTIVEAGNENVAVHVPHVVSMLTDIISKNIPPFPQPWPQVCFLSVHTKTMLSHLQSALLLAHHNFANGLVNLNL